MFSRENTREEILGKFNVPPAIKGRDKGKKEKKKPRKPKNRAVVLGHTIELTLCGGRWCVTDVDTNTLIHISTNRAKAIASILNSNNPEANYYSSVCDILEML
jgi:hypothetical protein